MNKQLGTKIRNFRKRSGLSQFDLEIQIGASPGSISRIENDQVNPTKETLLKIANVLGLNTTEVATLQGLEIFAAERLLESLNKIVLSRDYNDVVKSIANILVDIFPYYNGGVILLLDENYKTLRPRAVTSMKSMNTALGLLGKDISEFCSDTDSNNVGLIVRSINDRKSMTSRSLRDFSKGFMPDLVADMIGKLLEFRVGISIPIIINEKAVGAILYTKRIQTEFSQYEDMILNLLTSQIAITLNLFKTINGPVQD